MGRIMKKLIFFLCLLSTVYFGKAQTYRDTVLTKNGALVALYKPFTGTVAQMRANTNPFYVTGVTTDYGGGNWYYVSIGSLATDNLYSCLVDARGGRWFRIWDYVNLRVKWFGVLDDSTTDNTANMQLAVNAAYKRDLWFEPGGLTKWGSTVYLPNSIKIHGQGAAVEVHGNCEYGGHMFLLSPFRNSYATGIYAGGANQQVLAPKRRVCDGVAIENLYADGGFKNWRFVGVDLALAYNTTVEYWKVENCHYKRFSGGRGISVVGDANITDTSGFIRRADILNNYGDDGNPFSGLIVKNYAAAGDTLLMVTTKDKTPILPKLTPGIDIFLGTVRDNTGIDNAGYTSSNGIYRVKSYAVSVNDSSSAILTLGSASYSTTDGILPDTPNVGLKTSIVANAWVIPAEGLQNALCLNLANYTGGSGATSVVRATFNAGQNALHKNAWIGMKFQFNSTSLKQVYTITSYTNDTLRFTPALTAAITNVAAVPLGQPSALVYLAGNITKLNMIGGEYKNSNRGVTLSGSTGKGMYNEDLPTDWTLEDFVIQFCGMGIEGLNGIEVRSTMPAAILNSRILKKSDSIIRISTDSANYRIGTKDLGAGSVRYITAIGTNDASTTALNSLSVGDLVTWYNEHGVYRLMDISQNWPAVPTLTFSKWNQYKRDTVSGGFDHNSSDAGSYFRVYSPVLGQCGSIKNLTLRKLKLFYNTRKAAGYLGSIASNNTLIELCDFYNSERSALEIGGYNLEIRDCFFKNETFDGSKAIPSLTQSNGGPGRGFNGWILLTSIKVKIHNIKFEGYQPSGNYSPQSGSITIGANAFEVYPMESLVVTDNTMLGPRNNIVSTAQRKTFGAVSLPSWYYETEEISRNTINVHTDWFNTGIWSEFYAKKMTIKDNTVQKPTGTIPATTVLFTATRFPNPEAFDTSGNYDFDIHGNTYPSPPVLTANISESRFFWDDKKVTLKNAATLEQKTLLTPILTTPTINMGSDADGDILVRIGGKYVRIPKGTENQVFKINGGVPAWGKDSTGTGTGGTGKIPNGNF